MARRVLCLPAECVICLSIDQHNLSTLTRAFLRGYIAGIHVVSHGPNANERLCPGHTQAVDEEMAFYVGSGVMFPRAAVPHLLHEDLPRLPHVHPGGRGRARNRL